MMRRLIVQVCALTLCACCLAQAQTPKTVWDTHDDLAEWILFPESPRSFQRLEEGGRDFARLTKASFESFDELPLIAKIDGLNPSLSNVPTILDPQTHNAIRLTLRQTFGFPIIRGFWIHRSGQYDLESFENVPFFNEIALPNNGEWIELTFSMLSSPFLDRTDGVTSVVVGFFGPRFHGGKDEFRSNFSQAQDDAFLDVDRIELVQLAEPLLWYR